MRTRLILGVVLAGIAFLTGASISQEVEFDPKFRLLAPYVESGIGPYNSAGYLPYLLFTCDSGEQIRSVVDADDPLKVFTGYILPRDKTQKPVCLGNFSIHGDPVRVTPIGTLQYSFEAQYESWLIEFDNPKSPTGKSFVYLGEYRRGFKA